VDFLVTKNNIPWFLLEVKSSAKNTMGSGLYFIFNAQATSKKHTFQGCFNSPYIEKIDLNIVFQ
jgi:outer membrane protein assembly factor BamA